MNRTIELCARGEKTILVNVGGSELDSDKELDYLEVVDMDPLVQIFCEVYAEDLVERIGLDRRKLPVALGVATLLNPMFGLKSNVVGSGLMTHAQYDAARNELICELQDIMDETAPPVYIATAVAMIVVKMKRICLLRRILITTKHWQRLMHLTITKRRSTDPALSCHQRLRSLSERERKSGLVVLVKLGKIYHLAKI